MRPNLASSTVVLGPGAGTKGVAESDAEVVRRFRAGQCEALAEIVARHEAALRRLFLMLWDDRHEVDDLCQEVFVRLIEHMPVVLPGDSLRPWLYRIAVNLVRDRARRRNVRRWLALAGWTGEADASGASPGTDVVAERQEAVERLRTEIRRLDRAWREVVVLRDLQGLSPREVGELLGIPVKVVNDRLYRAHRRLAERMGTRFEQESS
jgi:RNA polymerase sigma factor (sigma-70 family)